MKGRSSFLDADQYTNVFVSLYSIFPNMFCIELQETLRRRCIGQQAGTKSACGSAGKSVVNRSLYCSEEACRTVVFGGLEGNINVFFPESLEPLAFSAHLLAATPSRPATSRHAPPRPAPAARLAAVRRLVPWNVRVFDSTGLGLICPRIHSGCVKANLIK